MFMEAVSPKVGRMSETQGNQGFIWTLKVRKDQYPGLKALRQEEFPLTLGWSVTQLCLSLCDTGKAAHQASRSFTIPRSLLKLMCRGSAVCSIQTINYWKTPVYIREGNLHYSVY